MKIFSHTVWFPMDKLGDFSLREGSFSQWRPKSTFSLPEKVLTGDLAFLSQQLVSLNSESLNLFATFLPYQSKETLGSLPTTTTSMVMTSVIPQDP